MIKVHRITAENFRALGHAVFEPLVDGGMTAVNGPMGVGKSSLLTAMMWALYGVTPTGVTTAALRRQNTTDPVRVEVVFEHDGQILTVERGLKGTRDAAYMKVTMGGHEMAFGKIGACQAWLKNRFGGLDAEGFMTAFVVRQKELDGLVKALPSERRKLIERLAGIDRMSAAVKTAREEETDVKKRLEHLPGDTESYEAAKKELEEAQQAAVDAWTVFEQAEAEAASADQAFAAAEAAATTMQTRIAAHQEAREQATRLAHEASLAHERANTAAQQAAELQAAAVGGTADEVAQARAAWTTAQQAASENQAARENADRARADADREQQRAMQATERAQRARAAASQARANADRARAAADEYPTGLEEQAAALEAEIADLNENKGALLGEYKRLTDAITALHTNADGAHCPTCATSLPDPAALITSLQDAQARVKADGSRIAETVTAKTEQVTTLRRQAGAKAQADTEAAHAAQQAQAAENTATEVEQDATDAQEHARQAAETARTAAQAATDAVAVAQQVLDQAQRAQVALRRAENAAEAAARVPQAQENAQRLAAAAAEATQAAEQSAADEVAKRVPGEEVERAQQSYRAAQQASQEAGRVKMTAQADHRVAEEKVRSAERARDAEDLKLQARIEAVADLGRKTAIREALDEFRKDRIASLAPELSEIATDSISRMTGGRFVAVELDEEFTPVVTDAQGNRRPAYWLSGGEESAVALSLRLAIGEVIAGQQGGLLWMDEPQTAMDAASRPAMMSVIREIPGRQPIIISHVTEATDMVDLVVEVIPDEETGSTVVRAGDQAPVDEALVVDDPDSDDEGRAA